MRHERPTRRVPEHLAETTPPETYHVIKHTEIPGRTYPFLDRTDQAWTLITRAVDEPAEYRAADTFAMTQPTLRWVNGGQVNDVYVEGLTTEAFLAATGLALDMERGGYVLSKRLSRIMRPYTLGGYFPRDAVHIDYLDNLDRAGQQVWDGAGLISHRMLERLGIAGDSEAHQAHWQAAVRRAGRVEFTLMTSRGQDKGHAIIADQLLADFILPRDTKPSVKLRGSEVFVGIQLVHGHPDMRLDIQSLINLYPFFSIEQLARWLADEGNLFLRAVASGQVGEAMARVDRTTTIDQLRDWPLREYLVSGGDPRWFGYPVRSLMNQHLERLNHSTLGKLRIPIPGGRYYVMPVGVGQQADVARDVPRGHICIDPDYSTAWVNDADWVQLAGSDAGIAAILGGADNDDALWVHPFTDYDGQHQVLAWRSPNQVGEYVMLKPTPDSDPLVWATPDGDIQYPAGDSRQLMLRIDTMTVNYLNLVDSSTAGGLGEGQPYSIDVMDTTLERAQANRHVLGAYCNLLMVAKAVYGQLPTHPPAPLEDVIDGSVKFGTDLSPIMEWIQEAVRRILRQGKPIPTLLQPRLGVAWMMDATVPAPVTSQGHWLDDLVKVVQEHITHITARRDALAQATMPPAAVFDQAFSEPEWISIGSQLNQTYTATLHRRLRQSATSGLTGDDYMAIQASLTAFLGRYPPEVHTDIVRGAMVSLYLNDTLGSDAGLWLRGTSDDGGLAALTLKALREIGVLDTIDTNSAGELLVYPGAVVREPTYRTVVINGVWFHWYRVWCVSHDQPIPATMGEVPPEAARRAKTHISHLAQTRWRGMTLTITTDEDGRQILYTPHGNVFGVLSSNSPPLSTTELYLVFALATDGNLRAAIR